MGSISSSVQYLNDLRQVVIISKLIGVPNGLDTCGESYCVPAEQQSGHILCVLLQQMSTIGLIALKETRTKKERLSPKKPLI